MRSNANLSIIAAPQASPVQTSRPDSSTNKAPGKKGYDTSDVLVKGAKTVEHTDDTECGLSALSPGVVIALCIVEGIENIGNFFLKPFRKVAKLFTPASQQSKTDAANSKDA